MTPQIRIDAAVASGARMLEEAGVVAPRLNAEVLLCHALGRERVYLFAHPEELLSELAWIHYGRYLHQRLRGKPTQYITHKQEFYGREFRVSPAVLIPRPETEHVVERALEVAGPGTVVDVGTGSGAIGVTLSLELGRPVVLMDVSRGALEVARGNGERLGAQVDLVEGDLTEALAAGSVSLLVSNPPYIPQRDEPTLQREVREFEPHLALFGGEDGSEVYRRLVREAGRVLRPGGWLVLELGHDSESAVRAMCGAEWKDVQVTADLAGIGRVFSARLGDQR